MDSTIIHERIIESRANKLSGLKKTLYKHCAHLLNGGLNEKYNEAEKLRKRLKELEQEIEDDRKTIKQAESVFGFYKQHFNRGYSVLMLDEDKNKYHHGMEITKVLEDIK